jgi:thioredoxin 1
MGRMNADFVDVACLCAAWCRLCDEYAPVLEAVTAEFARDGAAVRGHWIDIEDDAALVGDLDVETFPTLVVIDRAHVRFAGPLPPHPDTLRRLLRVTVAEAPPAAGGPAVAPEVGAFAERLRARIAAG